MAAAAAAEPSAIRIFCSVAPMFSLIYVLHSCKSTLQTTDADFFSACEISLGPAPPRLQSAGCELKPNAIVLLPPKGFVSKAMPIRAVASGENPPMTASGWEASPPFSAAS